MPLIWSLLKAISFRTMLLVALVTSLLAVSTVLYVSTGKLESAYATIQQSKDNVAILEAGIQERSAAIAQCNSGVEALQRRSEELEDQIKLVQSIAVAQMRVANDNALNMLKKAPSGIDDYTSTNMLVNEYLRGAK